MLQRDVTMQRIGLFFHLAVCVAWAGTCPKQLHVLSEEFSHGLFDKLPDFDDAILFYDSLPEDHLTRVHHKLAHLAEEHDVDEIMLGLTHKHFHMAADSFLGEELSPTGDLLVMKPHDLCKLGAATPVSFTLVNDTWHPYEWALNNSEAGVNLATLRKKEGFLQNVADILTDEGLDGLFGFHVKHRQSWEDEFGTEESPGNAEHELHIRPGFAHDNFPEPMNSNESRTVAWPLVSPHISQIRCFGCGRSGGGGGCTRHEISCTKHGPVCRGHSTCSGHK